MHSFLFVQTSTSVNVSRARTVEGAAILSMDMHAHVQVASKEQIAKKVSSTLPGFYVTLWLNFVLLLCWCQVNNDTEVNILSMYAVCLVYLSSQFHWPEHINSLQSSMEIVPVSLKSVSLPVISFHFTTWRDPNLDLKPVTKQGLEIKEQLVCFCPLWRSSFECFFTQL